MRYLPILSFLSLFCSATAVAQMPIYPAYVSDTLADNCNKQGPQACQLNRLSGDALNTFISSLPSSLLLEDALSLSDYEVLIGNAVININEQTQTGELVLEITTVWRDIPIDDITYSERILLTNIEQPARSMLSQWVQHVQTNLVFEADRIYQVLGASDYATELSVPATIGDFIQLQSAIYRDPLLGSITRYSHPRYDSAVVDISVYPFSPFGSPTLTAINHHNNDMNKYLQLEMENEIAQIKQSIINAKIDDYRISGVSPASFTVNGVLLNGLRLEVLLHTQTDPQYSTQYIFQQNDKVIKVTGNLPESMMAILVNESLPQIKVPHESEFMRALRQG